MNSTKLPDQPGLRPNRACRSCVQIKTKCVPCEDQSLNICQRCHRLGKFCATPVAVPRKRPRKKLLDVTKPQQTIVNSSQLFVGRQEDDSMLATPATSNTYDISPSAVSQEPSPAITLAAQEVIPWGRIPGDSVVNIISPEISHPFAIASHEKYFELFRTSLSKHFPFIVIPLHVTAAAFSKEKPFLYTACVMAGAHRNPPFQSRIARDMLKYVSERLIQAGEKNMDMLQGILICIAWYHVYTHSNSQLMNLLHLAKALMIDLGLNRPPGSGLYSIKLSNDAHKMLHGTEVEGRQHSFEQRRTYLAVYHASSKLCACFRRMDDVRWNDYLQDCCKHLETAPALPSDEFAAALVRLDHLIERYAGLDGIRPGKSMPLQAYVELFTRDLDQFARSLSIWLQEDEMMSMHLQNAELCMYEVLITAENDVPAQKVEVLHSCLSKVLTFFETTFLKVTHETLASIPFLVWAHVTHALDLLAKMSFIRVPGWDVEYARQNPGFLSVTEKLITKIRETSAIEESQPDNISLRFKIFAGKIQWCQQWYTSKLEMDARANERTADGDQDANVTLSDIENPNFNLFGDFNDMLWQDFMADWPTRTDAELGLNLG